MLPTYEDKENNNNCTHLMKIIVRIYVSLQDFCVRFLKNVITLQVKKITKKKRNNYYMRLKIKNGEYKQERL